MKTRNYISIVTLCAFTFIMGRMEQTDLETSEAIYCQNVAEWHADEMNNEPPRSRRGHPDYHEIYNETCEGQRQ